MTDKLTDNELWAAVVADNSKAFVALYNRHWKKLYKTAAYYLKDDTIAEEITHDVFVVLWEKRASSHIEDFQKYIQATIRYHVYKQLKAAKIEIIKYLDEFAENDKLTTYNTATNKLGYEDLETELAQVLKELPNRCQEIFWLSRINNLSNQEIADRLNISKRTVENQITSALRFLRLSHPRLCVVMIIGYLWYLGS
ncbi:RNA polymerase sigma-70 factor [Mucilaginibacter gynuensis]|uniref:RNA polymerase sigma-70 factor n=1 Tax=Mucilaginibacter gynuensis TaxID=1302236 RepID=A0ABP8GEQ3_9SPHI